MFFVNFITIVMMIDHDGDRFLKKTQSHQKRSRFCYHFNYYITIYNEIKLFLKYFFLLAVLCGIFFFFCSWIFYKYTFYVLHTYRNRFIIVIIWVLFTILFFVYIWNFQTSLLNVKATIFQNEFSNWTKRMNFFSLYWFLSVLKTEIIFSIFC